MKTGGRPRRELLVHLASQGPRPRVDVGADHGRVAAALDCVATERRAHRVAGSPTQPWVICDGLRAFRQVGTAVIAGMGARTIAKILEEACPVARVVLHAQDDPVRLRTWLAANGWCILDEGLAPEAGRFAEVVVAQRGQELNQGLRLAYGPKLLAGSDPHLCDHLQQLGQHLARLVVQSQGKPSVHEGFLTHQRFIADQLMEACRRLKS